MARVFLVNPPSPEPVRAPLYSFCHLAAALRAGGHEVAVYDASAPHAAREAGAIAARIEAFGATLVGVHLKTLHVQPAYALARALDGRWPLVAGGPHATVRPHEPLAHGFDFVVRGEGEEALPELADAVDGKRALADVNALTWRDRGLVRENASRGFLTELDALPSPTGALDLFDPAWYGATRALPPAGLLSSRGCPAACNFCANNVTGRRFRYRSPASIAREVAHYVERYGMRAFAFFDDSFAVGRRRVDELCRALVAVGPVSWTCTAHPAHLDRATLAAMKRAGCGGVDLGMESGAPEMLVRIGKGVTVERVLDVLGWCRELGLSAMVNLMFGWPDESEAELDATAAEAALDIDVSNGRRAREEVVAAELSDAARQARPTRPVDARVEEAGDVGRRRIELQRAQPRHHVEVMVRERVRARAAVASLGVDGGGERGAEAARNLERTVVDAGAQSAGGGELRARGTAGVGEPGGEFVGVRIRRHARTIVP